MFSPLICGTFQNQEEDDFEVLWGAAATTTTSSTSRKSRRSVSFCSRAKDSKNPYADRGLDKFSALLADLDDKRQKIFTQKGSEDISLVRFVYSNTNDCKPIVVKVRERKQEKTSVENAKDHKAVTHSTTNAELSFDKYPNMESSKAGNESQEASKELDQKLSYKKKMSFFTWGIMKMENWRRPSYYLPMFMILILLFLALFGRSFAILCTSLGWYIVPTINASLENPKKTKKINKEYVRKLTVRVTSPRSVLNAPMMNDKSPGEHGPRRSL